MNIASLADVKRVLHLTDVDATRDAALRASLAAIQSWADTKLWRITDSGSQVETYLNVYEDATLYLPASDVVVTKVKIYYGNTGLTNDSFEALLGAGYDITDNGRLVLRPVLHVSPFEGAVAQRGLRLFQRVEVYYLGSGVVPRAMTDGIATLAAGHYVEGDYIFGGLKSEKIGDYSYSRGGPEDDGSGQPTYVASAMRLLNPYLKKARVSVT